jgi:hypothetical protein
MLKIQNTKIPAKSSLANRVIRAIKATVRLFQDSLKLQIYQTVELEKKWRNSSIILIVSNRKKSDSG